MAAVTVTDYNVNTMTLTAKSGRERIDLAALRSMHARDAGERDARQPFVSHLSFQDGESVNRTGRVLKRNGRERRYSRRMFDNQATVVVRMPQHSGYFLNIKVFRNGNLQMTGARSAEEGRIGAQVALGELGGAVEDVRVQLMNCNFRVSRRVNRNAFHALAKGLGMQSSFNPSIYPAVKVYYMINDRDDGACPNRASPCTGFGPDACCKRVTVLVFEGHRSYSSAIITGATTEAQVRKAHAWLARTLREHPEVTYDQ